MSRSLRKHLILPITSAKSEKDDKRRAHRAYRHALRMRMRAVALHDDTDAQPLLHPHEIRLCDSWGWAKDGHQMITPETLAQHDRPWQWLRK